MLFLVGITCLFERKTYYPNLTIDGHRFDLTFSTESLGKESTLSILAPVTKIKILLPGNDLFSDMISGKSQ